MWWSTASARHPGNGKRGRATTGDGEDVDEMRPPPPPRWRASPTGKPPHTTSAEETTRVGQADGATTDEDCCCSTVHYSFPVRSPRAPRTTTTTAVEGAEAMEQGDAQRKAVKGQDSSHRRWIGGADALLLLPPCLVGGETIAEDPSPPIDCRAADGNQRRLPYCVATQRRRGRRRRRWTLAIAVVQGSY